MNILKKVRVLIVDDSLFFREAIAKGLSKDRGIEVIGTAKDVFDARDLIIDLEPDVLTLDVEMPRMNGIEFLKKLMPQYPMPVVVVSSVSNNVFDALNAGAVDFVTKPNTNSSTSIDTFIKELIIKIKISSLAKVSILKKDFLNKNIGIKINPKNNNKIIAIGASTGGTEAIAEIVKNFPRDMPGIVITQHMPPVFTNMFAERLNNSCLMYVKQAETGDIICPGKILIAPGDQHMIVKKKENNLIVECFKGEKVNGHCPSIDVLFNSIAEKIGNLAIGIILTGMGYDGSKGLLKMKQNGSITIGQDEASCVVYGMPKVAYNIGAVSKQVALKNIPHVICSILENKY